MLIYPAIDLLDGRCVRLRQGDYSRETVFSDDPAAVARRWVELGADRLHVVDLDGAKAGKPVNGAVIRKIVEAAGVPVQLGGGIRTDDDLAAAFDWGVRWAVLGTRALQDPGWVRAVAEPLPGPHRPRRGCEGRLRRHRGLARSLADEGRRSGEAGVATPRWRRSFTPTSPRTA